MRERERRNMVVSYLKNIQNVFLSERENIEQRLHDLQVRDMENKEFMKILEDESDFSYESFTPRELHPRNKEKLEELRQTEQEIQLQIEEENELYDSCTEKLEELELILREAQDLTLRKELDESRGIEESRGAAERINPEEDGGKEKEQIEQLSTFLISVFQQIKLCSEIAELDPHRCGVELREIVKKVTEQIRLMDEQS